MEEPVGLTVNFHPTKKFWTKEKRWVKSKVTESDLNVWWNCFSNQYSQLYYNRSSRNKQENPWLGVGTIEYGELSGQIHIHMFLRGISSKTPLYLYALKSALTLASTEKKAHFMSSFSISETVDIGWCEYIAKAAVCLPLLMK